MKIQLNQISEYQEEQCKLFSKYSVYSSLIEYGKRNQLNKEKIIKDIYNGKVAEFMVYNFLIHKQKKLNSPDLNIYEKESKSYSADLYLDGTNIHIKSHNASSNFPISWVFQKKDPLLTNSKDTDFLALVVIKKEVNYMYLKRISEVNFKEPIKENIKQTKLCIYESDFI